MSIFHDGSAAPIASLSAQPTLKRATVGSLRTTTRKLAGAEALSDLDTLCRFAYKHALFARTGR